MNAEGLLIPLSLPFVKRYSEGYHRSVANLVLCSHVVFFELDSCESMQLPGPPQQASFMHRLGQIPTLDVKKFV